MSGGSTGKHVSLILIRQHRLHASWMISHMQLCKPWVSQYGMHFPFRHWPRSWHVVPSTIGGDFGHSDWPPEHLASCSHVAYCASRHFIPAVIYWQFWQHGEFLSLQTAPWFRRNLQFLSQHASLSSVPSKPASHCSSPSTRKLPACSPHSKEIFTFLIKNPFSKMVCVCSCICVWTEIFASEIQLIFPYLWILILFQV